MSNLYNQICYPKDESSEKDFPQVVCDYLIKRFKLKRGDKILDVGCGRGFFANGFGRRGLKAFGIDIDTCDFEDELFPCDTESFDVFFTKSTLEHITNPENVLTEMKRLLKPGGLVICLVPDWLSQWKNFYDDSTHVRPYTVKGLAQAFKLAGFTVKDCRRFTLLRLTLQFPWLAWLPVLIRLFVPDYFKRWNVVRFSKERMILLVATKE